ncbi:armadillo repeat-containing protein 7-like [Pyrus ussuriensis x Pyrus communis]|uniref:Armadillo repeat-containing protein 7-like n=1 Tax=Pyrus ussuriensis x Pyrus communis TaxID=2448454 RepID=A0A5N5G9L3_9ROSA|nr:armadillo repeat-containing protein 7-like [Pyrus ussuriensis x Pyrus communis]
MIGGTKSELEDLELQGCDTFRYNTTPLIFPSNYLRFQPSLFVSFTVRKQVRDLNVLELFVDCITEPNEKLVEFGVGGICNSCAGKCRSGKCCNYCSVGIPLVIQYLSSPVRNTGELCNRVPIYLPNASNKKEIVKPEVVDVMKRYAAAEAINVGFSNLAQAFLDKRDSEPT